MKIEIETYGDGGYRHEHLTLDEVIDDSKLSHHEITGSLIETLFRNKVINEKIVEDFLISIGNPCINYRIV